MTKSNISSPYKGSGQLTREQFLFHEMRITAKLMQRGLDDQGINEEIYSDNLFQYPTEKMIKQMTDTCISRLKGLNNEDLVNAVATQSSEVSKQICLYAMMRRYRLVWDFMIKVIGEKYRNQDYNYSRIDINTFFMRLQEQDDLVASWSDSTLKKIKQILTRILVENDYLDNNRSTHLNNMVVDPMLEKVIEANGDEVALPAFGFLK